MSYPHGFNAEVSELNPQAHGICDRCGQRWLHARLRWQFQWQGPRLSNLRILVCPPCEDLPNENLRTIIIPTDPVPIRDPRPEMYVSDNNPNGGIGQNASPLLAGTNIGTLIGGAGTYAAFDGTVNKPLKFCAQLGVSNSSYNWGGKNWNADPSGVSLSLTGFSTGVWTYTVSSYTATAPNDSAFLGSSYTAAYVFQGSSDASTWTTLDSGTTTGAVAEAITGTPSGSNYQYHRFAITGDGTHPVAIAQLSINTANRGVNTVEGTNTDG